MIQAFHVYKQYDRESLALADVTLNVDKGEFCFLTGPSGAGKTTFLKLVFREELPSQGQILVGGRNVTAIPPGQIPELRRRQSSRITQVAGKALDTERGDLFGGVARGAVEESFPAGSARERAGGADRRDPATKPGPAHGLEDPGIAPLVAGEELVASLAA